MTEIDRYVGFIRAVNLGSRNTVRNEDLRSIFLQAGASSAETFINSGNVIFETRKATSMKVQTQAGDLLYRLCNIRQPIFVQNINTLQDIKDRLSAGKPTQSNYLGIYVTFFADSTGQSKRQELPIVSPRKDIEVFDIAETFALSRRFQVESAGDANPFLERILLTPCTTRNWNTVVRILAKFRS
ncbi:MAG: DUF1697 domain-containing protein [Verrucomicrobia bacterium]|nr:DUF1697 domain-containing protein [Verrucomicrobiota bacterium]MBV9673957.1 DUF1697 domain-containing protein [Verrucomicrobiota bacterium]